jgi:predicted transposase/invertase (TIGR01784 family)
MMIFFLTYVSYIRDIPLDQLKKILEECNIEGGDLMPSLAQRLMDEGKEKWIKEGKRETARRMLNDDFSIESITKYTGLTEKEVKELMN